MLGTADPKETELLDVDVEDVVVGDVQHVLHHVARAARQFGHWTT